MALEFDLNYCSTDVSILPDSNFHPICPSSRSEHEYQIIEIEAQPSSEAIMSHD